MFELTKNSPINKGKLHKIIINQNDNTADIEYQVGYEDGGVFKSIGVDKLFLQDRIEERDEEDNIIQEASSDYTDFIQEFSAAKEPSALALKELEIHGIKKT